MKYIVLFVFFVLLIILKNCLKSPKPKNFDFPSPILEDFQPQMEKGWMSEQELRRELYIIDSSFEYGGKILCNIYIPKESGDTTEIDLLYITRKGLFILENKDYAGYIFGSETDKNWTVTLYSGKQVEKYSFYNPIWQNNTHIKCLKQYLKIDTRMFSFVTFSERGELKNITKNTPDIYVCHHSNLVNLIKMIWDTSSDILDDIQITEIYNKLLPLTNVDDATKQAHINKIKDRFNSTVVCPVCGGKLVIRTAQKGSHAGNQFYGCSNYPRCRYTVTIQHPVIQHLVCLIICNSIYCVRAVHSLLRKLKCPDCITFFWANKSTQTLYMVFLMFSLSIYRY